MEIMYEQPETNSINVTASQTQKKVLYTAKNHTTGGRDGGQSKSSDGRLEIKLSDPGTSGLGTNPEQLLAAGWSTCFISAMRLAAAKMKVRFPADAFIDTEVDLLSDNAGYALQARLNISLPGLEREVAKTIAEEAHQICPYSKATRGNIGVQLNLL